MFLTQIIGTIVTMIILAFLAKATYKPATTDEQGRTTMRMQKFYYWFGLFCACIALVGVAGVIMIGIKDIGGFLASLTITVAFGWGAKACMETYKRHWVAYDSNVIMVSNAAGVVQTWNWKDVKESKFNYNSGYWSLYNASGAYIKLHKHLIGLPQFMDELDQRTRLQLQELDQGI